ncbi:hypothetical protein [Pseudomonas sp. CGJS7]|uniref:hypothetical protein n=1 Tax=Pseudomonas sp. CGJS7 TaxID=3109348 RepID=UPI00300B1E99
MISTRPSRGRALRWLAAGLLALLAACGEPAANVEQPKRYDRLGVQMQIPANWKLSDDERVSGMHYLAVESPGSALFIAMIQSDGGRDLGEFARSFSADADKSMPAMLSGESRFDLSGFAEGTVRERYVASIGGVKVPHLREYHKITGAHRTAFLITQSAEEDLAQTQPGFDLLVKSFKLTDR